MTKNKFCKKCGRQHDRKLLSCDEVTFYESDAEVMAAQERIRRGGMA